MQDSPRTVLLKEQRRNSIAYTRLLAQRRLLNADSPAAVTLSEQMDKLVRGNAIIQAELAKLTE